MTPTATLRRAFAAVALLLAATGARAEGLEPAAGQTIDLGSVAGTAYYTVQPDGFHVVATLADTRSGAPMRVETTLAAGQTVVLSTPGGRSGAPRTVEITRIDREVLVHNVALTN
ncbi:MAG: hypothetical protein ACRYGC_06805 [Janthinobacterium lividum]